MGEKPIDYMNLVLRLPEVLNNEMTEIPESEIEELKELTIEACDMVEAFRKRKAWI